MLKTGCFRFIPLLSVLFLSACGGGSSSSPVAMSQPPGTSAVSISMRDTPPSGVTVLSFQITITGATLQPGNISLINTPIQIEIERLQVEAAFLSTTSVPAGTYTSLTLNLANPELTIKNDTGAALNTPSGMCASGAVCEFEPSASGSFTFSGAPFPLTIMANAPVGLLVDANVSNIIQSDLTVNLTAANAFTVSQLAAVQPTGELEDLEDLVGVVANKDAAGNQFMLQTLRGNFNVKVDSNTEFEGFQEAGCSANNFTCVQNGQVVEVDLRLLAGGMFVAKQIGLKENVAQASVEGVITSVASPTQFKMVVLEELEEGMGVQVGNPITVMLGTGATFRVDTGMLPVPSALQTAFEGATDTSQLLPGQQVKVHIVSLAAGPPIVLTTDAVRLRMSRFTATVASVAAPNFTVNNLSSLFTSAGISQIQVQTSSSTEFEDVSGVSALAAGNMVSLRGLLFKSSPDPVLIASKVRKREPGD